MKLSSAQIAALRNLRDRGRPTFGVRTKAFARLRESLISLGLMIEARSASELPKLTDAGRLALAEHEAA